MSSSLWPEGSATPRLSSTSPGASFQPAVEGLGGEGTDGERASRFLPGTVLAGRYRIVRLVGRGGMGEVYQADDLMLAQAVALKFLPPEATASPRRRAQLFSELRMARRVMHAHVCRVYDIAEVDGLCFLSMEHIDGQDLATLLRRIGRLPREKALELGWQTATALEAIHARGILHRDLKPANLMLAADGAVRITDFGLAWPLAQGAADGWQAGTPAYRAPELAAGAEPSVASDLYSFGLALFELLAGRLPATPWGRAPALEARDRLPALPSPIRRAILACLADDPCERPASAGALVQILGRGGDAWPPGAGPPGAGLELAGPWRPVLGGTLPHRRHWRLDAELGQGRWARVWRVRHVKTGEHRVVKICSEAEHLRGLEREVTAFRLLRHELGARAPIPRLFDWSFEAPPYCLEMEEIAGGSLPAWAASRGGLESLALDDRLELVASVAEALAMVHSAGVLHRDVKPGNVLIRDREQGPPETLWCDLGLGEIPERERLARAGITDMGADDEPEHIEAGTRLYLAPERLEGKAASRESDVFALGVMLYQVAVADLTRALALGWQREIDDELLREDIAAAVDGAPGRRPRAGELAERLRRLPQRREERRRREARERARLSAVARRRWAGFAVVAVLVAVALTAVLGFHALRLTRITSHAEQQEARARDISRIALAGEWLDRDPTRAALVLQELEGSAEPELAAAMIRRVLDHPLARLELRTGGSSVHSSQWSPDGRWIAIASSDGLARVWPADGRGEVRHLEHEGDWVVFARWSPDSRYLATTTRRGTVWIWPVALGGEGRRFEGHAGWVYNAFWSPDGRFLATSSSDGTARVWSRGRGEEVRVFEAPEGAMFSCDWSPDGERLAAVGEDGVVRIWRLDGAADPAVQRGHEGVIYYAAFDPAGRRVLTSSSDGTARIWPVDGRGAARVFRGHEGPVRLALWSPDGERIVTASGDRTARVWRADGEGEPVVLEGHDDALLYASWSPGGDRILTNSLDRTARIWRADGSGRPIVLRGHSTLISDAVWSPDGRSVLTSSFDGTARVWPSTRSELVSWQPPEGVPRQVAWSPDGDRLAVATDGGQLAILDPSGRGTAVIYRPHGDRIRALAWSPDGRELLTAAADGKAKIVRPGVDERTLGEHAGAATDAAWGPRGERVVTADRGGFLRFWGADGAALGPPRAAHEGMLTTLSWSGDGRLVASAGLDGVVRLWAPEEPEPEHDLRGWGQWFFDVAWSPGGEWLAVAAEDHRIRLVPIVEGKPAGAPIVLVGHTARVQELAWSPDGRRLLSGSEDGTARVWTLEPEGASSRVLEGHDQMLVDVAWSPGGERVATASLDGTVRLWLLDDEALRQRLETATEVCLTPELRMQSLLESGSVATERHRACEARHGRRAASASRARTTERSAVGRAASRSATLAVTRGAAKLEVGAAGWKPRRPRTRRGARATHSTARSGAQSTAGPAAPPQTTPRVLSKVAGKLAPGPGWAAAITTIPARRARSQAA